MSPIQVRVIPFPNFLIFNKQDKYYKISLLPIDIPILSVEVCATRTWDKYSYEQSGINCFGASGKGKSLYELFELVHEGIEEKVKKLLRVYKSRNFYFL